jgi:predicted Zn-dependent protease
MFGQVPLLMAVSMGGIGAFLLWKLWQLAFEPHARLQNLQLKHAGRIRRAGWITILLGVPFLLAGVWGGFVRTIGYLGDLEDSKITLTLDRVFAPGYVPSDEHKAHALRAIALKERAGAWNEGGIGWSQGPGVWVRLAWLRAVAGDLPGAERELRRSINAATPSDEWASGLADVMRLQGKPPSDVLALYTTLVEKHPTRHGLRATLATLQVQAGKSNEAQAAARHVLGHTSRPHPKPPELVTASTVLLELGLVDEAQRHLDAWIERTNAASLHMLRARVFASQRKAAEAIAACKLIMDNADATNASPGELIAAANTLAQLGQPDAAIAALDRLANARVPGFHQLRLARAQMLVQLGRVPEGILDAKRLLESSRLPHPEAGELASAAELLIAQDQASEALRLLNPWIERRSEAIFTRVARARATFFTGKPEEAISQMRDTIKLDPTSPLLWSLLAELLEAAGKPQEARTAAQNATRYSGQMPPS